MRKWCRRLTLGVLVSASWANADPNDLQIYRLGNPVEGANGYRPDANANFRAFARTLGASISSVNLMPPETLGHAAFSVNAELAVVGVSSEVEIPTVGAQPGAVLLPSLHVRKGLPFSIELGSRVAWIEKSRMVAGTGEIKWAVNEGFTSLPDVGIRLHVTRLFGNPDFNLTTAGLDVGVGKQFPLAGMVTLTPYGGLDLTGVAASSSTVDFDPGRAYENTLASPNAALEDTAAYDSVTFGRNIYPRVYGGVRFIGGVLQLGTELSLARLGGVKAPELSGAGTYKRGVPPVISFNTTLGLDF